MHHSFPCIKRYKVHLKHHPLIHIKAVQFKKLHVYIKQKGNNQTVINEGLDGIS